MGAGGMGVVYRANDPRLHRDVAIKIAAVEFNERSAREARLAAALNHVNICHIYNVRPNYLVMELVEGPTLSERLKQGPMPLDEPTRRSTATVPSLPRLSVDFGDDAALAPPRGSSMALSPDGSRIVFLTGHPIADGRLAVRRLDQAKARPFREPTALKLRSSLPMASQSPSLPMEN
jgi:hypothetical protein